MVDYDMTLFGRLRSWLKPIPFKTFKIMVGDWEITISDSYKNSPVPSMQRGLCVASSLPPYQVFLVGKMGRDGKVYIDHVQLGHEMQHCLAKRHPGIIADVKDGSRYRDEVLVKNED